MKKLVRHKSLIVFQAISQGTVKPFLKNAEIAATLIIAGIDS